MGWLFSRLAQKASGWWCFDQDREADRMAFREAVGAEALDLLEAAFGEVALIAALSHALDEHVAIGPQLAVSSERGHRPAQAVGVVVGELRGQDGQTHGLFLEERDPVGFEQNLFQLVRRSMFRSG
jgi:hypothetical protein